MASPEFTSVILAADRRAGSHLRSRVQSVHGGHESARLAADTMAPAFQALALGLLLMPGSRMLGARAAVAGAAAGLLARIARDAIGRPRPGARATVAGDPPKRRANASMQRASAVEEAVAGTRES
jgi:hypothetical protein